MKLPGHFERFLANISVDQSKLNRIVSAHTALCRALRHDEYVRPALREVFLQGSYVHGTTSRPLGDRADFDVDVCCSLDLAAVPTGTEEPKRLVRWLARRLKRVEAYRGKVSTRPRCVRIDFPGAFHMDVVPLIEDTRGFNGKMYVPNRTANDWEATNPKGLEEWYRQQNARTNGRFVRVAKMLKHWRNQALSKSARPPSVGLEVMIAEAWPLFPQSSDAGAVAGVLRQLDQKLRYSSSVPSVMNPSLNGENLLRDLAPGHLDTLSAEVAEVARMADEAHRERNETRSISLWQRLFRTRFPQRAD